MGRKRRGWLIGLVGVALFAGALAAPAEAQRRLLVVGTAPAGTASFPFMVGVATIVNKEVPELALSPQETGGTVANIRLLDEGKVHLSGFSSMVAADAVEGKPPFKKKHNVQVLFNMYQHRFVWFARKASGITSWDGVVGKKMALGTPAGSTRVMGDLVVAAKGLRGKATLLYIPPRAMLDSLRDGTLDAGFGLATGASVAPWVQEALATLDLNFFGLDEETIRKLAQKPGIFREEFPAGFFEKRPGFATIAEYLVAGVSAGMDERTAYAITRAVVDNLGRLPTFSPAAKGMKPQDALKGVPANMAFHPGAVRYYKEKGLMK